jgi:cytochrome c oxidase subunit 1
METPGKREIHLPKPSYWPIVLALSVLLIAAGVVFSWILSLVGVISLLAALVGWTLENRTRSIVEEIDHE